MHEHAWPMMQALIDAGVIGDFRSPDILRFGFTPLYTSYVDVWDAIRCFEAAWRPNDGGCRNTRCANW
ncbi:MULTISPECIES: kynureninase/PvdN C-terminal domain-containing protein [unclassified Ensifer]|uniref:kynureninase/PvdN C-terminal domain-containing protein n=1 Tax=unclassified Ensifer TaxID=2633371 RepID=UPI003F90B9C2